MVKKHQNVGTAQKLLKKRIIFGEKNHIQILKKVDKTVNLRYYILCISIISFKTPIANLKEMNSK